MADHQPPEPIEPAAASAEGSTDATYYTGPNSARWVVLGFLALVAALVLYMALGMPGMDHGGGGMDSDMPGMDHG